MDDNWVIDTKPLGLTINNKPTHYCKKHGKVWPMNFFIDGKLYGRDICSTCYADFIIVNCNEVEEIKDAD